MTVCVFRRVHFRAPRIFSFLKNSKLPNEYNRRDRARRISGTNKLGLTMGCGEVRENKKQSTVAVRFARNRKINKKTLPAGNLRRRYNNMCVVCRVNVSV